MRQRVMLRRVLINRDCSATGCRKRRVRIARQPREAALLTSACQPAIAYSRVGTGRTPSAMPSSSNFPASHLGSDGLIAQSYRAFSSPPLGRPTRLPGRALFCRRRHQPRRPPLAKRRLLLAQYSFNSLHNWHFEILFIVAIIIQLIHIVLEAL
jgi:hypothetical protein